MTCGSYVPGGVPSHLAPPTTTWTSWERYCWAVQRQAPGYVVAALTACDEGGALQPRSRRRVMSVLGATLGPDGIGPRIPPGGLSAHTDHAREHSDGYVADCPGCKERRKDPPYGGYGPNTGDPAFFWQDESGRWAWEDGRPPVPCGQWYEAP